MLTINKTLIVALAATTILGGAAFAANEAAQTPPMSAQQKTLDKDAGKLSADGAKAYNDVALTRLAIFDGRIKDAKTYIDEADADFGKAKTDDSVFVKAEADFKSPNQQTKGDESAAATAHAETAAANAPQPDSTKDATTPKKWLPVDAEMTLAEDFTANPAKVAAVADANKSLAKGDKQGAMAKLKLANVDLDYIMAVVPLDQTLTDVHQAATLIDGGKYYEASQMLRQVQDSTRYDMLDVSGVPKSGATTKAPDAASPATH